MKVKKPDIYEVLIFLCVLFECQFWAIFPGLYNYLNIGCGVYNKTFCAMFATISFVVFILSRNLKVKTLRSQLSFWNKYIIYYLLGISLLVLYSGFKYSQGLYGLFIEFRHYLVLLLVPCVVFVITRTEKGYESIEKIIIIGVVLNLIAVVPDALSYNITGNLLFENVEVHGVRNHLIRIAIGSLYTFVPFIFADKALSKKKSGLYWTLTIASVLFAIYIEQTRAKLIYFVFSIIMMVFFLKRRSIKRFVLLSIIFILFIVLINTGYVGSYINSFAVDSRESVSTLTRLGEYSYFWGAFVKNPLFGIGLINDFYTQFSTIKKGAALIFYPGDVGIVGLFGEGGIVLGLSFLLIVGRMVYILKEIKGYSDRYLLFTGLCSYTVVSCITMVQLRGAVILFLTMEMGLFEGEYLLCKSQKKEKIKLEL